MKSTDNTGEIGRLYAAIVPQIMEQAIKQGVEAGVKAGEEYIEAQKRQERKGRHDRRLHNTRLLLKNYRNFKNHALEAISTAGQAEENAIDILDTLDEFMFKKDRLYIESIKQSQKRTAIILAHINKMLGYYKISCEQSGKPEEIRRYKVIMATYVDEPVKNAQDIAEEFSIDRRTVYKDITAAITPLTALFFGIDGMKIE